MKTSGKRNKGGRPTKPVKRTCRLRVACTVLEVELIKSKAQTVQLTVSEFLRDAALKSQITARQKTLPAPVLNFTGLLNHLAANINALAYKNNAAQTFNAFERIELKQLVADVKQLAQDIKYFLK